MDNNNHTLVITYNYDRGSNSGWWVTVYRVWDDWVFDWQEGARRGTKLIPVSAGFAALLRECRSYMDETAWIWNGHENRRRS